jgi:hypothetical protein
MSAGNTLDTPLSPGASVPRALRFFLVLRQRSDPTISLRTDSVNGDGSLDTHTVGYDANGDESGFQLWIVYM